MIDKEKIINDLVCDEGLRLKPYRCTSGKLTIGVGRNIDDNGIRHSEAMFLLTNDIEECILQLQTLPWFDDQPPQVKRVLVNMCFNLGFPTLKTFTTTLNHIKNRDYQEASESMLKSKWAKQVGARAVRLSNFLKDIT